MGRCSSAKFWLLKRCHGQPFASDKKLFGSGPKTLKKDNQRCRITANPLQKCKECLCGISFNSLSESIGSGLAAVEVGSKNAKNVHVIYRNNQSHLAGPCSNARNHACKQNADLLDNLFI